MTDAITKIAEPNQDVSPHVLSNIEQRWKTISYPVRVWTRRWSRLSAVTRTITIILSSGILFSLIEFGTFFAKPDSQYYQAAAIGRYFVDFFMGMVIGTMFSGSLAMTKTMFSPITKRLQERRFQKIFECLKNSNSSDHQRVAFLLESDKERDRNRLSFMEYLERERMEHVQSFLNWVEGSNTREALNAANDVVEMLMPKLGYGVSEETRKRIERVLELPSVPNLEKLSIILAYNALSDMQYQVYTKKAVLTEDAKRFFEQGFEALRSKLDAIQIPVPVVRDATYEAQQQLALAMKD